MKILTIHSPCNQAIKGAEDSPWQMCVTKKIVKIFLIHLLSYGITLTSHTHLGAILSINHTGWFPLNNHDGMLYNISFNERM